MIAIAEPNLGKLEIEYTAAVIASGWVSGGGPYVEKFEEMVAKSCGKRHCVATITGTAALHAAMRVLGFSGLIRVPVYTFAASRNVIKMIGAKVSSIHDTSRLVAHDGAFLRQEGSADQRFIVDAAPAVGCIRAVGATAYTLSFNGNKTITTGQGGAILCDDAGLAEALRIIIRQTQYSGEFNYRMPNFEAAMGCAQMERLDEFLEKKRAIWLRYQEADIPVAEAGSSRWMCLVDEHSIKPGSDMPFETRYLWGSPYWCLPCSTNLTEADQDKVIKCVSSQ